MSKLPINVVYFIIICSYMATEDLDAGNVWNPTLTCLIRPQSHLYDCTLSKYKT
jgi:hypothetical protein